MQKDELWQRIVLKKSQDRAQSGKEKFALILQEGKPFPLLRPIDDSRQYPHGFNQSKANERRRHQMERQRGALDVG